MSSRHTDSQIGALQKSASKIYLAYYMTNLLVNVFLICLYTVQVFGDHANCITRGSNTTDQFKFAFSSGCIVLIAESLNSNVICIYFRYKVKNEESETARQSTQVTSDVFHYCRWLFGFLILSVSVFQYRLLSSDSGKFCTKIGGPLDMEGEWLLNIMMLHLGKFVVFTAWEYYVSKQDAVAKEN